MVIMSKSRLTETKRPQRKVDLAGCYQEVGIAAVAAALRCQVMKNPKAASSRHGGKQQQAEHRGPTKY
jgi:hypothetical protein